MTLPAGSVAGATVAAVATAFAMASCNGFSGRISCVTTTAAPVPAIRKLIATHAASFAFAHAIMESVPLAIDGAEALLARAALLAPTDAAIAPDNPTGAAALPLVASSVANPAT